jgi:primosomal protein N' (replication factor Y)
MLKLSVGAGSVKSLADKGWIRLEDVEVFRDPYESRTFARTSPPPLTAEQQQVFQEISASLAAGRHNIFLVHGVTGSGKTEVYLQAIRRCLELGKEAIVLVPEISLTPQMVERFKGRFGDQVAVLHSRLSHGERYDEWRKIALRKASVAVGARSAVFAPFTRLGLIIIDEEHESSYKQDDHPKYHARDVAIRRGLVNGAVVVLGSATPSLESYCLAAGDLPDGDASAAVESPARDAFRETAAAREAAHPAVSYRLLPMRSRVHGRPLPEVHIVDMREELKAGNRSMFSRPLHQAIEQRLLRKEQTVLLLNRRGYATFVMCRSCGYVIRCPHCDISLTYHLSSRALRCHYCGYAERERDVCPDCASEHIRHFGAGTQRVEEELARLFPGIRVIRMDVDTTAEKGSHEKWLTMFRNRQADVLLGTQMVAKGLDFPNVTLVGVITADTVLNLPDFRSAEKTFQLLTQVAGRAGRHELSGEVFVQTYAPDHYSIVCAGRHDYAGFVREELPLRRLRGYPPFWKLILITLAHEQPAQLIRFAEKLAVRLKELAADAGCPPGRAGAEFGIDILGPVASPIPRIKDRYRFQCMVKYVGNAPVQQIVRRAIGDLEDEAQQAKLAISVDVDPQLLL